MIRAATTRPLRLFATRLASFALGLALLSPGLARAELEPGSTLPIARGVSTDVVRARIDELAERLEARRGDPGAAAELIALGEIANWSGQLEHLASVHAHALGRGRLHPEVRPIARRNLAKIERLRGRWPRMEDQLAALGVVKRVAFVGPFDDENKGGFDVAYGPEQELDLEKRYGGLRGEVRFRVVDQLGSAGTIELADVMRPSREVLAYVFVLLEVKRDERALIHVGSSGATKAWLSGKPILADPAYHPARPDQRQLAVTLRRGVNPLLLKVAAGEDASLALELRVTNPRGGRLRGLKVQAPSSGTFPAPIAIPAGQKILGKEPLVELLRRKAASGDAQAKFDLARVLDARRGFDDAEKLHVTAALEAARVAPARVEALLLAARVLDDDSNERRRYLEAAVAIERTGTGPAHTALASFWLEHDHPRRALELLESHLAQTPDLLGERLVYARALDLLGATGRAKRELISLAAQYRGEPIVRNELASYHRRDGELDAAMRNLRVAVALRPADAEASSALASVLVDKGQVRDALQVLENARRFDPVNVPWLLREADLLAANGHRKEAKARFAQAAAIAPQEAEIFERAGRAALRAGDAKEALTAFARSLRLRPQDPQLKELVRSLTPGAESFGRVHLHELEAVTKEAVGKFPGEDAVTLVELNATRVLASGQAAKLVQSIVQVRTQRGVDDYRTIPVRYAPEREEVKIERARVRKPDGSLVDAHGESDRSLNEPWSGLYYDTRALVISFPNLAPGDTIELVYRIDDIARDNLLSDYFGDLHYLKGTEPKLHWTYVLEMPAGRELFASALPQARYTSSKTEDGSTLYRWSADEVEKIVPEPGMPGWAEVTPYLHVSTYRDWDAVARFWWGLVKDQVAPTPRIAAVAKEIVAGIPPADVEGRVRAVYEFVVTKTRYVGLEFGIHSFKPYKVEKVLSRAFGDCKDKASLLYALLRTLDIDSRLVLLRMRHLGRVAAEPASLAIFNHAVLYVPSLDLFLDGTAEWSGARELPASDHGAEVLVVDPSGVSEFRLTPEANPEHSTTSSTFRVALAKDGSARLEGESRVAGLSASAYRRAYAAPNGRKALFEQAWASSFPGLTVSKLDVSDVRKLGEDVQLAFGLEAPRFAASGADGQLTFTPFGRGRSYVASFAPLSQRRLALVLDTPSVNRFRYELRLPPGYAVRELPRAVTEASPFGAVRVSYRVEGGHVIAEGEVRLDATRVAPADYPAFRAFVVEIDEALAREVTLSPAGGS